ncbi:hypothetical protein BOTBODRAFT_177603 [Botryobasidium botryosum FD-172 SS1]|uniref:G-patch domain-containing protein n=1 Tax=Botryobasidium botryosum (strain FD-172 SS1) TaxID=930990 RepID=A0A067MGV9_BOTB1|nr:hypothetical protein BOTBODRAFT_177603 [Botryobasidium botryosum FD-172 SS1]
MPPLLAFVPPPSPPSASMATVAYHIVSHDNPPPLSSTQHKPSDVDADAELAAWNEGHTFGLSIRAARPPKFVPAMYDDTGAPKSAGSLVQDPSVNESKRGSVSDWYRQLAITRNNSAQTSKAGLVSLPPRDPPMPIPAQPTIPTKAPLKQPPKREWFISRALASQQQASAPATASTSSLGDILARAPPPLPSEPRFVPPVYIALGPGNRGYGMLARNGWVEGEGLGNGQFGPVTGPAAVTPHDTGSSDESLVKLKEEVEEEVVELYTRKGKQRQVIDLTHSSDEDGDDFIPSSAALHSSRLPRRSRPGADPHGPSALLTPLPTILKSDRLGIGLKPKRRRVLKDTAEVILQVKRDEARQKLVERGVGRRGMAKKRKEEERGRTEMLAYMNN